jgi:hypothetical protein
MVVGMVTHLVQHWVDWGFLKSLIFYISPKCFKTHTFAEKNLNAIKSNWRRNLV